MADLTELGNMALRSLIVRLDQEEGHTDWDRGFYRGQISTIDCYMTPDAALLEDAKRAVDGVITGASSGAPVAPAVPECEQSALCRAAIQCSRIIDDDEIVLWRDPREPGSALDQLDRRLTAAIAQPVAAQGDITISATAMQEIRALIANLAAVVRVQNGNLYEDTNSLLTHADKAIAILAAKGGAQ